MSIAECLWPMSIAKCLWSNVYGQINLYGQMSVGQMSVGQMSDGQMSDGKMSFGQRPMANVYGQMSMVKCLSSKCLLSKSLY